MNNGTKLLAASILAMGLCVLVSTGCVKASAPKGKVTLAELSRAVIIMSMSSAGAPRSVDELTNFPAFKGRPFPAPPAGKTFAIDPATHQIVIVPN